MSSEFTPDNLNSKAIASSLKHNYFSFRTLLGVVMTGIAALFTILAIVPLMVILTYLVFEGLISTDWGAMTQLPPPPMVEGGGFGNAILGTGIIVGIGFLISVPIGVMAAIYLSEFSSAQLAQWLRFATNVLSGVPSIVVGVFAYGIVVLTMKSYSAWAGGFALAILMLPIIIRTTDEALKLVPQEIRQASAGLGANDYQTVLQIVLPAVTPAIITGVTLAIARAAGETAPLLFTTLFSQFWPNWNNYLKEPTASLAVLVYNFAISPFENQQRLAWAASFILVLLVMLTSVFSRMALSRRTY